MSLADEVEDWLAKDVSGHVDRISDITRLPHRHSGWERLRLTIPRPGRPSPDYVQIDECAPADLRAIADVHDAAAAELVEHAAELRGYADDLEHGTDVGQLLSEHLRVMRASRVRRRDERAHAFEVARADGGVIPAFGDDIGVPLVHARILTKTDARAALLDGRLMRVKGIGPARFSRIARELGLS